MPSEPTQKDRDAAFAAVSAGLDPEENIVAVLAQAIATARAEGFADGMERAELVVLRIRDSGGGILAANFADAIAQAIRAAAKGETK